MKIKLGFVLLLYIYHFKCHQIYKQLQRKEIKYTSNYMRLFNEVATVILFAIIFLITVRHAINWIYGVIGIFTLSMILMILVKIYKRYRKQN